MYNRHDIEKWGCVTMNCMKCGRETAEEQVFCAGCLEEMERYPVKPGTVVHIPSRAETVEVHKTPRRKKPVLPVSEQMTRLRKKLLWTRVALAVMLILFGILCFAVGRVMIEWDTREVIGQNYTAVDAAGNILIP